MEFYLENDSLEGFEGIHNKRRDLAKTLAESHPTFKNRKAFLKPEKFSSLSAEERYNFTKKIQELQKLINEIQTGNEIPQSGFTLEEVLEVLTVRRTMQHKAK